MSGYAGAIPHVVLSRTLWLLVAPPLLGLVWHVAAALRGRLSPAAEDPSHDSDAVARKVGIASVTLAAAATGAHFAVLSGELASGDVFLEYVAPGVRVGWLDAPIALSFDALAAFGCVLACAFALTAASFVAWRPPTHAGWRAWAWIELALAGALLSFLADGLIATALGWGLAAAAGAWLAGWSDAKAGIHAATRSAFGITALLLGSTLLFWGLGGLWRGDDYIRDTQSRFVAVRAGSWDDAPRSEIPPPSPGLLTLASTPGTPVFLDEARTPAMTSPFVDVPLPAGPHTLHLFFGAQSNEVHVQADGPTGESSDLLLFGPTLSLREVGALPLVRDRTGDPVFAREIHGRAAPGALRLVSSVLSLWILAAWAISSPSSRTDAPGALIALASGVTTAMLGPFLLVRASFLLAMAPRARILIASIGAAMLVRAVGWGLGKVGTAPAPFRWVPFLAAAPGGLAWMALGMVGGATEMKMGPRIIVCGGLVVAALLLLMARRSSTSADPLADPAEGTTATAFFFEQIPERMGVLLMSYERWVIDAVVSSCVALVQFAAWAAALADRDVLSAPVDAAAARIVRLGQGLSPVVGGSLARAAWATLAFFAIAALGLTLWLHK